MPDAAITTPEAAETTPQQFTDDDRFADSEPLVEEVSIDGMCGVY